MANLFANGRVNNTDPTATALRVQASVQGTPVPIGCGQTRWAGILFDYDGFYSVPVKNPGGKGGVAGSAGKGNNRQYAYYASGLMLLGEGQIVSTLKYFNGNLITFLTAPTTQELTDLANIGISSSSIFVGNPFGTTLHNGAYGQAVDSYWNSNFGSRALAYGGLAYVTFPNLGLGSSSSWPAFSFECLWGLNSDVPALGPDANPADWITQFLTNADWGVPGFPSSMLTNLTQFRTYCRATGMLISLVLTGQTPAASHLQSLMDSLNSAFRWTNGQLDIVPYGDQTVTGNGYTFTPNLTPLYAFGPDDFLENQGSLGNAGKSFVAFSRANVFDIYNQIRIEYLDRKNLYNPVIIYESNDASITAQQRLRIGDVKDNHFFNLAGAASQSISLQMQRLLAGANLYEITVGRQFVLVDVMDCVSITEPALQLSNQLCRVIEIKENADSTLTMKLEEVPLTAAAPVYVRQSTLGQARNNNAPTGNVNAPFFFEPPDALGNGLYLLIGLSGSMPANYGGCEVWISSDATNYSYLGDAPGASRMGVLTASLPSIAAQIPPPTVDGTNTLSVDLTESLGALQSVSSSAFGALATICAVDSEVIAFETATLTAANKYNLTVLARGAYGSTIASHASGANFMRLDAAPFSWNFPSSYVGQTVYFKFLAYNSFGAAIQSLASASAYPYAVQGAALSSPLPNVANLTTRFTGGFEEIFWDEIQDFRTGIAYQVKLGAAYASAQLIATQAHPPFTAHGAGTYWVTAVCTPITGLTVSSASPSSITITSNQLALNSLTTGDEQAAGWLGTLGSGVSTTGSGATKYLIVNSPAVNTDYTYYSPTIINCGYLAQAALNASIGVIGTPASATNILAVSNVFSLTDIFGSYLTAYVSGSVIVRIAGQGGSPSWGSWQKFVPGVQLGQYFQFGLTMRTSNAQALPEAQALAWAVQLPIRIDHYQNLSVGSGGYAITFQPDYAGAAGAFSAGPAGASLPLVTVDFTPAATGEYAKVTSLTLSGCTVTIYNASNVAISQSGVNVTVSGY